jgi:hypothetical protein
VPAFSADIEDIRRPGELLPDCSRQIEEVSAVNDVWDKWVGGANARRGRPGETKLAAPDDRVEIIATAALL